MLYFQTDVIISSLNVYVRMYVCLYVCREIQELFFELEECEYEIDRIEMLEIEAVEAKRRTEVPAHIYIYTYIHTYMM